MSAIDTFPVVPVASRAKDAHRALADAAYTVATEIIARSAQRLPGLAEDFTDRFVVVVGGQQRGPLGSFEPEKWLLDDERLHEINLNADRRCGHAVGSRGEDAVITLAHEIAHLYCHERRIRDTSNRGRYHNKHFAYVAQRLGCATVRPPSGAHGFTTPSLNDRAQREYPDLIDLMDDALRLSSASQTYTEPLPAAAATSIPMPVSAKYVFASCLCRNERGRRRTLRMATGWWPLGSVWCETCRSPFTTAESQPLWSTSPASPATTSQAAIPTAQPLPIAADTARR